MNNYDKKTEELLIEMAKREELQNKRLIKAMWIILITSVVFYLLTLSLAVRFLEEGPILLAIVLIATAILLAAGFLALKLEVEAGYYECKNCKHRFVPSYKEVIMAMHIGTTRYLKCPECHKRCWDKKVMTK